MSPSVNHCLLYEAQLFQPQQAVFEGDAAQVSREALLEQVRHQGQLVYVLRQRRAQYLVAAFVHVPAQVLRPGVPVGQAQCLVHP